MYSGLFAADDFLFEEEVLGMGATSRVMGIFYPSGFLLWVVMCLIFFLNTHCVLDTSSQMIQESCSYYYTHCRGKSSLRLLTA